MAQRKIAVSALHAKSNRFQELLPLVPALLEALAKIKRGELVALSA